LRSFAHIVLVPSGFIYDIYVAILYDQRKPKWSTIFCGIGLAERASHKMGVSRDLTTRQLAGLSEGASVEHVRVRVLPDGRMTREDAARYLGHQPKTLAQWQVQGKGPRSVMVGGRRFYFREDLDSFIRGQEA
jgi:helix-turn-helix protein